MALENKLGIADPIELAHREEQLTDKINDRAVYMKGIDASYRYEGYNTYRTEDL